MCVLETAKEQREEDETTVHTSELVRLHEIFIMLAKAPAISTYKPEGQHKTTEILNQLIHYLQLFLYIPYSRLSIKS